MSLGLPPHLTRGARALQRRRMRVGGGARRRRARARRAGRGGCWSWEWWRRWGVGTGEEISSVNRAGEASRSLTRGALGGAPLTRRRRSRRWRTSGCRRASRRRRAIIAAAASPQRKFNGCAFDRGCRRWTWPRRPGTRRRCACCSTRRRRQQANAGYAPLHVAANDLYARRRCGCCSRRARPWTRRGSAARTAHDGLLQGARGRPRRLRLLEKGAALDAKDENGRTALMWACANGHVEAARLLLEKGADRTLADNDFDTAAARLLEPVRPPRGEGGAAARAPRVSAISCDL